MRTAMVITSLGVGLIELGHLAALGWDQDQGNKSDDVVSQG
jgi:hypothetical protein